MAPRPSVPHRIQLDIAVGAESSRVAERRINKLEPAFT